MALLQSSPRIAPPTCGFRRRPGNCCSVTTASCFRSTPRLPRFSPPRPPPTRHSAGAARPSLAWPGWSRSWSRLRLSQQRSAPRCSSSPLWQDQPPLPEHAMVSANILSPPSRRSYCGPKAWRQQPPPQKHLQAALPLLPALLPHCHQSVPGRCRTGWQGGSAEPGCGGPRMSSRRSRRPSPASLLPVTAFPRRRRRLRPVAWRVSRPLCGSPRPPCNSGACPACRCIRPPPSWRTSVPRSVPRLSPMAIACPRGRPSKERCAVFHTLIHTLFPNAVQSGQLCPCSLLPPAFLPSRGKHTFFEHHAVPNGHPPSPQGASYVPCGCA